MGDPEEISWLLPYDPFISVLAQSEERLESNMLEDLIDHFLIYDELLALEDTYNRLVEVLRYPPRIQSGR